ncbi:MAG: CDP-diacylglycerol---glycerol-3-phosphate 3-phosphatidyltransferase [Myxococcales bacterium]|jgi:CDP-diacylglycerol--glycerol-3-phosphate 3-phosphatidyltransferase|nr:CDP-diacylglycerol---glycerol-3-phosphate 3-phosphatidyltransferase [Myxococcales bacterium]
MAAMEAMTATILEGRVDAAGTDRRLRRTIAGVTFGGAAMLIAAAASLFSQWTARASFAVGAGAAWLFFCTALWRRRALNVSGDDAAKTPAAAAAAALTVATWITVTRALLVCALAGFFLSPIVSPTLKDAAAWIPGSLYLVAVLGDLVDGAVARRLRQSTRLGASLDITTDALGLLVAPLLAVRLGRLPPWYLLLSVAYPLFQAGLRLRARWHLPSFPERLRPNPRARILAGVQMGLVTTALFPVLPPSLLWPAATVIMAPTLVLFAREWRTATAV